MKTRNFIWLAVAVLLLGAGIWAFFQQGPMTPEHQAQRLLSVVRRQEQTQYSRPSPLEDILQLAARLVGRRDIGYKTYVWDTDEKLSKLGPTITPLLLGALTDDPSTDVRSISARVLGLMQQTNTLPVLTNRLLLDPNDAVRQALARALQTMNDIRAAPALLVALQKDSQSNVRAEAAEALGTLRFAPATPAFVTALQTDSDHDVRAQAATALGNSDATGLFDVLANALSTQTNARVRKAVVTALGWNGDARVSPLLLPLLSPGSGEPEDLRANAAEALGRIGNPSAAPVLMTLLKDDLESSVRRAAAEALGYLGDAQAAAVLESAIQDRNEEVRQQAVWALGHLGYTNAIPSLAKALHDRDDSAQFAAACALGEIGHAAAVAALQENLTATNERTRLATALALTFFNRADGLSEFRAHMRNKNDWERFTSLLGLMRLATPEAKTLLAKFRTDPNPALQRLAARASEGAGEAALLEALREKDRDIRHYAARALLFFNTPASLRTVAAAANDPSSEVREAARLARRRLERLAPASP